MGVCFRCVRCVFGVCGVCGGVFSVLAGFGGCVFGVLGAFQGCSGCEGVFGGGWGVRGCGLAGSQGVRVGGFSGGAWCQLSRFMCIRAVSIVWLALRLSGSLRIRLRA